MIQLTRERASNLNGQQVVIVYVETASVIFVYNLLVLGFCFHRFIFGKIGGLFAEHLLAAEGIAPDAICEAVSVAANQLVLRDSGRREARGTGRAGRAGRSVGGFSLGMRQRLQLAAALLGDPGVLVLDEPANGLDPAGIRWMRDLLRGFANQGGTVLLSSHLLHEVEQIADELAHPGGLLLGAPHRLADLVVVGQPAQPDAGQRLQGGTFHAVAHGVISRHTDALGLPPSVKRSPARSPVGWAGISW